VDADELLGTESALTLVGARMVYDAGVVRMEAAARGARSQRAPPGRM